jgi:hypothetical protein
MTSTKVDGSTPLCLRERERFIRASRLRTRS